jgi:putative tricarboxylic transport membrane protein
MFGGQKMKTGNILSSLISIAIGCIIIFLSKDFPKEVSSAPGPGFYPKIISYILIGLGIILLIQTLFTQKKKEMVVLFKSQEAKFVYKIVGITILYLIMLTIIGFTISTLLFLFVTFYVMGLKSYKLLIIIPIVTTTALLLLFKGVFHIPLPDDILF